ncbi:uncharacterized protein TNCV_1616631 [Trichonephila clavipes]|nr:uncharacterized protein TNCV_1616631 [Trichonephila clavipes]
MSTSNYYRIWKSGVVVGSSLVLHEPEYPYTIFFEPNFGMHVPRSFGKTVIVFTSHLDLTWDKGVDLKFFRVGRSPSRQVWEAYQPQNTEAYPLDHTHCTRLVDVYVIWLTWLDDWALHRDENLPWYMQHVEPTHLLCSCQRVSSPGQASAHRTIHCHDSQQWQRSPSDGHHGESCRAYLHAPRIAFKQPRTLTSSSGTPPLPKSVPVEYLSFCVRGKLSQMGRRGLMVVKGTEQQKFFLELGVFAMSLETLLEFNDIYDGTFLNSYMRRCTRTFRTAPW